MAAYLEDLPTSHMHGYTHLVSDKSPNNSKLGLQYMCCSYCIFIWCQCVFPGHNHMTICMIPPWMIEQDWAAFKTRNAIPFRPGWERDFQLMDEDNPQYTYVYIMKRQHGRNQDQIIYHFNQPSVINVPVCLMLRITINEYKLVLNDLNGVSKDDFPIEHWKFIV